MEWHPLKAELDERCLYDILEKYHIADEEYDDIKRCYRRLFPMVHAAVCYKLYNSEEDASGRKIGKIKDIEAVNYAEAVITLGNGVDNFQDNCQAQGNFSWGYYTECISMELLSKAYEEFDNFLQSESGLWAGDYEYIGSDYPLEEMIPVFARLRQKQVTYNNAFALEPRASVAFVVPLYAEKIHKRTMCETCLSKDCKYRRADYIYENNDENSKAFVESNLRTETDKGDIADNMSSIGLVHLYTGDGKGKTTAAIGLAIRAAGSGKKVVFTQFMKGQDTSELRSLSLIDNIKVIRNKENLGWFKKGDPELAMAFTGLHNETLDKIKKLIETHECDVLIMDEITYPYNYSIIDKNALEKLIVEKPKYLEIILTGRNADSFFTENSDYITEMKKIKHPYDKGIMAREGIEF